MQCADCQSTGREAGRRATRRDRSSEPLRRLSCASCGRLLPAPDSTDRLLRTLMGLSRFGLTAEARPILARVRVSA